MGLCPLPGQQELTPKGAAKHLRVEAPASWPLHVLRDANSTGSGNLVGGKGTPFTLQVMGRWPPALLGIQRHKNGRPTWLENDLEIGLQAQAEAPAA